MCPGLVCNFFICKFVGLDKINKIYNTLFIFVTRYIKNDYILSRYLHKSPVVLPTWAACGFNDPYKVSQLLFSLPERDSVNYVCNGSCLR